MSRETRTVETFDIILHPNGWEKDKKEGVHRSIDFKPGCTDVFLDDLEYALDIFRRIASDNYYTIEIIRKIHVWCRNCGGYLGNYKGEYKEPYEPYVRWMRWSKACETQMVNIQTRTMRCNPCGFHTTFKIEDQLRIQ